MESRRFRSPMCAQRLQEPSLQASGKSGVLDGTLVGWGSNIAGQTNVPIGTFTAVAAGLWHGLAIRTDGTLVGWGNNDQGLINVPTGTFTAVAAGLYHSLAIRTGPTPGSFGLLLATDSAAKPGSNTWTSWSDRRLKGNIQPLTGALDRLLALRGVTFDWLDATRGGGRRGVQMGLIADEVENVFPQWVARDPSGYQTLTVSGFEALTAEALRELRKEKDAADGKLEEQNAELRAENAELQARVDALEALVGKIASQQNGGGR